MTKHQTTQLNQLGKRVNILRHLQSTLIMNLFSKMPERKFLILSSTFVSYFTKMVAIFKTMSISNCICC